VTLAEPVCPQGIVTSALSEGQEEPQAPGTSPVDEGLAELGREPRAEQGGEP